MVSKKDIKKQLFNHCINYVAHHIEINRNAVTEAQSAVTGETKNTAGDRYETERAMKQRETELFGKRLDDSLKMDLLLQGIDIAKKYRSVVPGALVSTSIGEFFIAISADEVVVDGKEYDIISPESPICRAMATMTVGESFVFRDKTVRVLAIC
jgi:hypothetical protein